MKNSYEGKVMSSYKTVTKKATECVAARRARLKLQGVCGDERRQASGFGILVRDS